MAKVGRPPKINPEIIEKIVSYVEASNYIEVACLACGISESTYYSWKEQGERNPDSVYGRFLESVKKAEANAEVEDIAYIREGRDNWQARAWIRERKAYQRWGRKDRHEVSGKDGKPIEVEVNAKQKLTSLLDRFAARETEKEGNQQTDPEGS